MTEKIMIELLKELRRDIKENNKTTNQINVKVGKLEEHIKTQNGAILENQESIKKNNQFRWKILGFASAAGLLSLLAVFKSLGWW